MRLGALWYVLFFLLCSQSALFAQGFPFNESGYESVMQSARSANKPVLYLLYASWCPHCHVMRDQVFPDVEVSKLVQTNFLVAAQDAELPGGKALMRKYNANSYPSFVVLDPGGKLLYGFNGELKKDDFIKEINQALDPQKQLPFLASAFAKDKSNASKCLDYIMALRKARQSTSEAAAAYFATQTDEKLISAVNWKIIANGITNIDSREFRYVLEHQGEFAAVASRKRVERKIENIVMESLKPHSESGDTLSYRKARLLVKAMNMRKADSLGYVYDKQIYERVKNWKAYREATFDATDKFAGKNYQALRNTAAVYLAEFNDAESLNKAISWSAAANAMQPSKEGYLQTAGLYEKTGDIPKATDAAVRAKEFCEKVGFGTREADEMLKRLQSK